jgi:hypothetical protein
MNVFSYMIIFQLLLSLFVTLYRSDFIGIFISMGILIIYYTSFEKEPIKNINRFLYAIAGNIFINFIWILLNLNV